MDRDYSGMLILKEKLNQQEFQEKIFGMAKHYEEERNDNINVNMTYNPVFKNVRRVLGVMACFT